MPSRTEAAVVRRLSAIPTTSEFIAFSLRAAAQSAAGPFSPVNGNIGNLPSQSGSSANASSACHANSNFYWHVSNLGLRGQKT
jgi:hypothetical protein